MTASSRADSSSALMSIYRPLDRPPRNDVHHVAEHVAGPDRIKQHEADSSKPDWTEHRKAHPLEALQPATTRWIATLPAEFRPTAVGETFPRIANALAEQWSRPEALTSYLSELLVDTRGGRRGFPVKVLRELHTLRAFYAGLHPERSDLWSRPKRAR